jgi:hypothetical protein
MRQFWKRREDRADWPEPRTEFLHSLADKVSETRGRRRFPELRLAFVLVVAVALLLPLAAFAGRSQKVSARETVKAVASILQANTTSRATNRNGDDDDDNGGGSGGGGGGGGDDDDDDNGGGGGGGGGGDDDDDDNGGGPGYDDDDDDNGDDDDDNGDDDDDNGGYDDDDDCDNFGARRSALAHHQNQERETLRQHQNTFHSGTSSQRQRHFKDERFALHLHQMAERQQLRDECPGGGDDDDDDDGGGGGGDDDDDGGGGGGGDDDDD